MRSANVRLAVAVAMASVAGAGCAKKIPLHDGYRGPDDKPWTEAVEIELDDGEGEIEGRVSYPDRRRAEWYAVKLGSPRKLSVELSETAFDEAALEAVDVAFEVLDPRFEVLVRADAEAKDAGKSEKKRSVKAKQAGTYLIHVYVQERTGEMTYKLEVDTEDLPAEVASTFPDNVAFVNALAKVPEVDDAPKERRPRRPRPQKDKEPEVSTLRGRIAGIQARAGKTMIRIDRGSRHGVAKGWKGAVTDRAGNAIANGSFSVQRVTDRESFATVNAAADAVLNAKYVRLRAP